MQTNHDQPTFYQLISLLLLVTLLAGCVTTIPGATVPGEIPPHAGAPTAETDNPAALNQRQVLAMQLQLDLDAVEITSVETVTWGDQCLGVPNPVELCAAAETPGYRITLTANGEAYVYHTNEDGSLVRLAEAPAPQIGATIIEWTGTDDSGCNTALISADGVAIGRCYAQLLIVPFGMESRIVDLAEFAATFAPFEADTPAGAVIFNGAGNTAATPAQQRMIAEWARLVQLEAQGGRSGASWGLAFAWHREGGFAGFCDDLTVYVTGEVWAGSCRGATPEDLGHFRLSAEQLTTLYLWVDTFAPFEYGQRDLATADSMTVYLLFSGAGAQTATEADQALILDFAQHLFTEGIEMGTEIPSSDAAESDTGEAYVEAVEVRIQESFPVQVQVVVRGQLPDACAFVEATEVSVEGNTFYVSLTVARKANMRCAQMLTPFEEVVPLDTADLPAGTYSVQAGEVVAEFDLQQ